MDKICAIRKLVMHGLLPEEKKRAYKEHLAARDRKNAEKRERKRVTQEELMNLNQDENFFIAGYTPGGAPYGITWDQAGKEGLVEGEEEPCHSSIQK